MYVCVYVCVYIYERDDKELGHMIMETEKSQDLHLARGTQETQRHSSILRSKFQSESCRLQTQEGLVYQVVWRQEKNQSPSSQALRQDFPLIQGRVSPLFSSGLQLMQWGPPELQRPICFIQPADSNVNLIQKHPHRHTQSNVWLSVWTPHDPTELTHKINHVHVHGDEAGNTPFCAHCTMWPAIHFNFF